MNDKLPRVPFVVTCRCETPGLEDLYETAIVYSITKDETVKMLRSFIRKPFMLDSMKMKVFRRDFTATPREVSRAASTYADMAPTWDITQEAADVLNNLLEKYPMSEQDTTKTTVAASTATVNAPHSKKKVKANTKEEVAATPTPEAKEKTMKTKTTKTKPAKKVAPKKVSPKDKVKAAAKVAPSKAQANLEKVIKVVIKENPRREGSDLHKLFQEMIKGSGKMTVSDYYDKGGSAGEVKKCLDKNWITLK